MDKTSLFKPTRVVVSEVAFEVAGPWHLLLDARSSVDLRVVAATCARQPRVPHILCAEEKNEIDPS